MLTWISVLEAKYTQNDKKIPTGKTLSAFSEKNNQRWLKIQEEGAWNGIKSAGLPEN